MDTSIILNVVLVAAIIHGVFLALVLQLLHERNKAANKILAGILLISVLMLLGRLVIFNYPSNWSWYASFFFDTIIFIFGPLVYIYTRRLMYSNSPTYTLTKIHAVPALIHIFYCFWYVSTSETSLKILYENNTMNIIHFMTELLGILSLGFYLGKAVLLYRNYKVDAPNQVANIETAYKFVKFFLSILVFCLVLWMVSFISIRVFSIKIPFLSYDTIWISVSVFIYIIGYYSLRQPEIFRIYIQKKETLERDRLNPQEIKQLQKRLGFFIQEEEVYLHPDITLKTLSEKLNTSTNNLSWFLNNVYHVSFYDYINTLRIDKFLQKIEEGQHHKVTLLALAMDVGFNSKSTFNKVFKSKLGTTPSLYIKQKSSA